MSVKAEQTPVLPSDTSSKPLRQNLTPLFEQLINTIELIDSIGEGEPESSNGDILNNGNTILNTDLNSSLSGIKQRMLAKLPVLIWQRKIQSEEVAISEKPEVHTVIENEDKKDGRRNVSFFQLSNTLQVSYPELRKIMTELGIECFYDDSKKIASAIVNMEDILRLRDHIIALKNTQQESFSLGQDLISLSETARRLNTSVGTIIDAIEKQQLPLTEYPGGQRYISIDLLSQIGKFTEQQDALERLIRFSQNERTRGKEEQLSSNNKKEKINKRTIFPDTEGETAELEVKLIEFALQNNLPVDRVIDATRTVGWKFEAPLDEIVLTSWHQGILKSFLGIMEEPNIKTRTKALMPDGALSTAELTKHLGITYQTLIRLKLLEGISSLKGRKAKYYTKEDVKKITDKLILIRNQKKTSKKTMRASEQNKPQHVHSPANEVVLPDGAITFNDFLGQLQISEVTLRKLCKTKNIQPLKSGRTAYFDIDLQATITALVEASNLSRSRKNGRQLISPPPSRETSGTTLMFRRTHGREGDFFRRLPDEGPPAKQSDEAWERYQENLKKRMRERRNQIRENLLRRIEKKPSIIAPKPVENVLSFGTQLTIIHPKLGRTTLTIVPINQVDIKEGKISPDSPLISALKKNGHKEGDKIVVNAPQGEYEVELVSVVENAVKIITEED